MVIWQDFWNTMTHIDDSPSSCCLSSWVSSSSGSEAHRVPRHPAAAMRVESSSEPSKATSVVVSCFLLASAIFLPAPFRQARVACTNVSLEIINTKSEFVNVQQQVWKFHNNKIFSMCSILLSDHLILFYFQWWSYALNYPSCAHFLSNRLRDTVDGHFPQTRFLWYESTYRI